MKLELFVASIVCTVFDPLATEGEERIHMFKFGLVLEQQIKKQWCVSMKLSQGLPFLLSVNAIHLSLQ